MNTYNNNNNYVDFYSITLLSIYYYYIKNYYFLLLNCILYIYILFVRSNYIFILGPILNNNLKKFNNLIKKILLNSCKYLSRNYEDKESIDKSDLIDEQRKLYFKNNLTNEQQKIYMKKKYKFYKKKYYYDNKLLHLNNNCNIKTESIVYLSRKLEKYFEKNNLLCNKCKFYKEKKKQIYISSDNIIHSCKKCKYNDNTRIINIYDDEEYNFIKKTYIFCDYCLLVKDNIIKI
jgi:hypothetical protein